MHCSEASDTLSAEKRTCLLQSVGLAIAEAKSFDDALLVVLRRICEAAGWSAGAAWVPLQGQLAVGAELTLGPVWHGGDWRLADFFSGARHRREIGFLSEVMKIRSPLHDLNFTTVIDRDPERFAAARRLGVQAAHLVPVYFGPDLLAILDFCSLEAAKIDEGMTTFIATIAAQLGLALHNKRTEQVLRQNLHILEAALDLKQMGSGTTRIADGGRLDCGEAIGKLAAGVAHDFNNILGVIIGNLDLLRPLVEQREGWDFVDDALEAALHGAELTRSLLACARGQPLQPKLIDVNDLVLSVERLLRRALGEDVGFACSLSPDQWTFSSATLSCQVKWMESSSQRLQSSAIPRSPLS